MKTISCPECWEHLDKDQLLKDGNICHKCGYSFDHCEIPEKEDSYDDDRFEMSEVFRMNREY